MDYEHILQLAVSAEGQLQAFLAWVQQVPAFSVPVSQALLTILQRAMRAQRAETMSQAEVIAERDAADVVRQAALVGGFHDLAAFFGGYYDAACRVLLSFSGEQEVY